MRVNEGVRQVMLESSLWPILTSGFYETFTVGKVEFFDNDGNDICELRFDDMDIVSTGTGDAVMRLKSIDGTHTLKGSAHDPGTGPVTTFKIRGLDPDSVLDYVLVGSVGTLTSSAELRFNITEWQDGTFITIQNFDIIIPNGA